MGYSPLPRARGLHRASGYPSRLPEPISARELCGLKRGESGFGKNIPKTKNTPLESHSRGVFLSRRFARDVCWGKATAILRDECCYTLRTAYASFRSPHTSPNITGFDCQPYVDDEPVDVPTVGREPTRPVLVAVGRRDRSPLLGGREKVGRRRVKPG